jgi:hypothetical protein
MGDTVPVGVVIKDFALIDSETSVRSLDEEGVMATACSSRAPPVSYSATRNWGDFS